MGRDGARGLLGLRQAGWHTIAQDEPTSVVYGMPRAALENGGVAEVLPIGDIARAAIERLHHLEIQHD
jgi:two-component system response regulator WspF